MAFSNPRATSVHQMHIAIFVHGVQQYSSIGKKYFNQCTRSGDAVRYINNVFAFEGVISLVIVSEVIR